MKMNEVQVSEQTVVSTPFWANTDAATDALVKQTANLSDQKHLELSIRSRLNRDQKDEAEKLERAFAYAFHTANGDRNAYSADISKLARTRKGTSKFMDRLNGYLQAYSGVIQVMNGAGPGYGDAAHAAVSLLLAVSVQKQKAEELIGDMLETLEHQYSRIQMLKDVYATPKVKEFIAMVYRLGIEFMYTAAWYYSAGTLRRLRYIISRPPSLDMQNKVSQIQVAIDELQKEMNALDGLRLNRVEKKLGDISEELGDVKETVQSRSCSTKTRWMVADLSALRAQTDTVRLEHIGVLLGIPPGRATTVTSAYSDRLSETFAAIPRLPPLDVTRDVFSTPSFQKWHEAAKSSLFLLHGQTIAPDRTLLSWLSPASVAFMQDSQKLFAGFGDTSAITHHSFQSADYYEDQDRKQTDPHEAISRLVFQLLSTEHAKRILRDDAKYSRLKLAIGDAQPGANSKQTDQMKRSIQLLKTLLTELELRQMVIVLDRVDAVRSNLDKILLPFAGLIKEAPCVLKVFAVMRTHYGFDGTSLREELTSERFTSLEVDQYG